MSAITKSLSLTSLAFLVLFLIAGCGVADGGKITARDILKQNKDADIIQYDGHIFSNVTNLEWFEDDKEEISFSKNNFQAEIKKQTTSTWFFNDLSATKLPKGTKVYSLDRTRRGMLIVEYEGEILYYMELLKG
ncbi:hypothetical protein GH741_02175 [Aquibacillus halophilus]|uniref:Lipoprotein n=1 Tax=Aquibacillus halophilus TaxID=930132 RepID=A0A6A8D7B2_9BACI|nr:hypothetical protein [Aquibacillus halophilus]MRH41478.1 hypothetical protein [Aquibacillus halophilus]